MRRERDALLRAAFAAPGLKAAALEQFARDTGPSDRDSLPLAGADRLGTEQSSPTCLKNCLPPLNGGGLGQVLRAAVAQRLVERSPMEGVRLPRNRAGRREIVAWSAAAVQEFLAHPRVQASPLHSLLVVGFFTGCRRGELLGLTPADIVLDGRKPHLWVRRSLHQDRTTDAPKTDNARRRLPLAGGTGGGHRPGHAAGPPGVGSAAGSPVVADSGRPAAVADGGQQGVRRAGPGVPGQLARTGVGCPADDVPRHAALVRSDSRSARNCI
jgi:hypothetical protein